MLERSFNGTRLKEGRVYRGLTLTDLADNLNVSKQMISKYENGKSTPSFEVIMKMCNILNFPKDYFYEESINVKTGNTYFRSLLTSSKREREMQYDRIKYVTIIRVLLEEFVDFPSLDLPSMIEDDCNDIEKSAEKLRDYWGIGRKPIRDMVYLLETKGFVISTSTLPNKNIDAFGCLQTIGNKDYYSIVLSDNKKSFYRRQFDVSHELAHIILHDPYLNINDLSKEEFKQIEQEANDFASAFLMPRDEFLNDVLIHPTDLMHYKSLKKKWGVSIGAMVMRAYKLGVINNATYQYLQRNISQKGWRTKEPFDDIKEINQPVSMQQAIELLIENDYVSGESLLYRLSKEYGLTLNASEVEDLIGLEIGYLSNSKQEIPNNIVKLKDI